MLVQYLTENGYDPNQVMIGAIEWHSGNVVNGLVTARGEQLTHRGEDQTEIDAAMVPTRLFDMQEAGQTYHWREAIQDFVSSYGFDWGYPLFRQFGSIGVTTGGGEAFHYHGVKKANYNAFVLVDKLEGGTRLSCRSAAKKIMDGQGTVNCLAVSQPRGVYRVLIWSYISPRRYVDRRNPGDNRVRYDELYSYIRQDLGSAWISVDLTLQGLPAGRYRVTQWAIDKTTSNAWHYEPELCWALGDDECRESFPGQPRNFTPDQVNSWVKSNNVYGASVALESTVLGEVSVDGMYQKSFQIWPYSVTGVHP